MPSFMVITSFEDIYNELLCVQHWLNNNKISTNNTRLSEVTSIMQLIKENYAGDALDDIIIEFGFEKLFTTIVESDSFCAIYKHLSKYNQSRLPKKKLREAIGGPFLSKDEIKGDRNVNNRNALFELELAAKMIEKGKEVIGFDDVEIRYDENTINFQCKRLISRKNVRYNINQGYKQIEDRIIDKSKYGILSLSIDKIYEVDKIFSPPVKSERELASIACTLINDFIMCYKSIWDRHLLTSFLGVFVILKYTGRVKDRNLLVRGTQIVAVPRATCPSDTAFFLKFARDCY